MTGGKNLQTDTIAAIATAIGDGGIAVIRLSGPEAGGIRRACFLPKRGGNETSGALKYGHITGKNGEMIDEVMSVFFAAPRTYTREDVAEIHCHGGRMSANRILQRVIELGARPAEPGEFTLRAFMNGRIDLSEAEAVMEVIRAGGEAAQRAAYRQLEGGVSRFVHEMREKILAMLAAIEAATDFPDEIDEDEAKVDICAAADALIGEIDAAADEKNARIVTEGLSVVLIGRPNVGKSSLMNAMLRQERAIVSYIPGTTRDVLTERLSLSGLQLLLSDTAGQRDTDDPIERIGVDRARRAETGADIVLLVLDVSEALSEEDFDLMRRADNRYIIIINKTDAPPVWTKDALPEGMNAIEISAVSGAGLTDVYGAISKIAAVAAEGEHQLTIRRHIECAHRAKESLERAKHAATSGQPLDIAAVDLWDALTFLSAITGENAGEDVISRVFQDFCVGK